MVKKSLKYVLKLILVFAVISYSLDKMVYLGISQIGEGVYTGQSVGKLNQYLKFKDSLDFIVYGSSRANHNIDPSLITNNGFNMGVDGQKIAFSATLVKFLPKKKQTIFFHVEPKNALDIAYEASDLKSLKTLYNKNWLVKEEMDSFGQNNPLQNFYWCTGYSGKLLGIVKNYFIPGYDYKSYTGYDPISVSKEQRSTFKTIVDTKKVDSCETTAYQLNEIYDIYLNELKDFAGKNNKTLIFFTSPVFRDDCKEDNIFFEHIMKNKGLRYYDFTDLYREDSTYAYWKDLTHLSSVGAEKFTTHIKKTIFD